MKNKLLLGFLALGITSAFAASNTFKVNLEQNSIIDGQTVKAGDYKIQLDNGVAVMKSGKETIQVPAHEETEPSKFPDTELTYKNNTTLEMITIGGTRTKIVFGNATAAQSGM